MEISDNSVLKRVIFHQSLGFGINTVVLSAVDVDVDISRNFGVRQCIIAGSAGPFGKYTEQKTFN